MAPSSRVSIVGPPVLSKEMVEKELYRTSYDRLWLWCRGWVDGFTRTDRQTATPCLLPHTTQTHVPVLDLGAHAKVARGGRQLSGDLGNQSAAGRQGLLPPNGHQVGRVEVGVHAARVLVVRDGLAGIKDEVVFEVGGLGVVEGGDSLGVVVVDDLEVG